jgi:hypothetical protein
MDGRHVVQRLINGETALEIARSFGYRSPTPVMDVARDFIVSKLGAERYSALADQPGMGYVRIARVLGKEALMED